MRKRWSLATASRRSKAAARALIGATALLYLVALASLLAIGTDAIGFALGALVVTWGIGVFLLAGVWVIGFFGSTR